MPIASTLRIKSRPSTTLPRMLATWSDVLNFGQVEIPNTRKHEDAFADALERSEESRILGMVEADKLHEELVLQNLSRYRGTRLIVFDGVSPNKSPSRPERRGSDIFHPMNNLIDDGWLYVVDKYTKASGISAHDLLGSHLVTGGDLGSWVGMTFTSDDRTGIANPFSSEIVELERVMRRKGKDGYGSLMRFREDPSPLRGNLEYSEGVLDYKRFREARDASPHADIDEIIEMGGREAFYESERTYIHLIRALALQHHVRFLQELRPELVRIYAMQGSATMELWAEACRRLDVPFKPVGGEDGLLDNAKTKGLAELNPTAIGRLEGMVVTWYNQRSRNKITPRVDRTAPLILSDLYFRGCPWESGLLCDKVSTCGGPDYIRKRGETCMKTDVEGLDEEQRRIVREFQVLVSTGVMPIEGYFYSLNRNDNALGFEERRWKSWILERGNGIVVPHRLNQIPELQPDQYGIRISDLSHPISLEDFITKPKEEIERKRAEELARVAGALLRGQLWHRLIFEGTQSVYQDLIHPDFQMHRSDYCDAGEGNPKRKHLAYTFTPTSDHLERLLVATQALYTRRKNPVNVDDFEAFLYDLVASRPTIVLYGHADSVGRVYREDLPESQWPIFIIDGKTSPLSPYGSRNILNQEIGYGHAVKQMHGNSADLMVATTLHPRYDPNRNLPPDQQDTTDYGSFVRMVPFMRNVFFGSEDDRSFHTSALLQYAGRKFIGM